MKRLRLDETVKELSGSQQQQQQQHLHLQVSSPVYNQSSISSPTTLNYSSYNNNNIVSLASNNNSNNVKVLNEGMQSGLYTPAPAVNYGTPMPTVVTVSSGGTQQLSTRVATTAITIPLIQSHNSNSVGNKTMQSLSIGNSNHSQLRSSTGSSPPSLQQEMQSQQAQTSPGGSNFHRLKVEDALSYLDLVKYKFGSKPQVYNDFLDIMKEFKSQSIDTPGVIQRVSNLFKGFPELIDGFNTFLPPGYKIEVQRSDQGYAFQVSVSMPSPPSGSGSNITSDQKCSMILRGSGVINMSSGSGSNNSTLPLSATIPQQCQPIPLTSQHHISTNVNPPPQQQQSTNQQNVSVVHHSSGYNNGGGVGAPGTGGTTTNYNNSISAAQVAVSQALQGHTSDTPQNQPVQFNHAINYVNKIKNRFQDQPEKYKKFLDILHIYQKEQRTLKDPSNSGIVGVNSGNNSGSNGGKHLTEQEVYSQVAKLFENQSDLLAEFGQFLPDATSHINNPVQQINNEQQQQHNHQQHQQQHQQQHSLITKKHHHQPTKQASSYNNSSSRNDSLMDNNRHNLPHKTSGNCGGSSHHNINSSSSSSGHLKRSPPYPTIIHRDAPPVKKHKISSVSCRDVSLAEAAKFASLNDYAFFDKVRKAVRTPEVYHNFLRCLILFNQEIISKSELIMVVSPFLGKFPELMRWFREFLGQNEIDTIPFNSTDNNNTSVTTGQITASSRQQNENSVMEIDYTTCKRIGASYCVIPKTQEGLSCSGRTQLCKEVLNDQWVSFPTWSEDSTFVSSRKTQYEEYMYRCEDERFELDVVIETNASTIRVLEGVNKKLNRMNPDEVSKYRLDDNLGGTSTTLHQRALKRIYGDKANDIIEGLKRNPAVAVPVVLRRLKSKEEEWREAQKGFNKIWREQNEKYYLKSLDHQGINFKQNDIKALRSKSLYNEIETIYDERHEQNEHNVNANTPVVVGPHLVIPYRDRTILDDATNLLIHHVRRQTGIQKGEKRRIKHLLKQFLPELFFHPKQQLTDDEREDEDEKDDDIESPNTSPSSAAKMKNLGGDTTPVISAGDKSSSLGRNNNDTIMTGDNATSSITEIKNESEIKIESDIKVPLHAHTEDPEEAYTLFIANSNWYVVLRLHAILCERLAKIYERAVILATEEAKSRNSRKESTAIALRLKPKPQIEIEEYYPAFLDMVKNLLDGNMDANTYEDTLREMFGIHAYIAFTLDKVVSYAVRQLQNCVTESPAIACTEIFLKEQKRDSTGGLCITAYKRSHLELSYQRSVEKAINEDNCFKVLIYKKDCRMTIELLDSDNDENNQKKVDEVKKWSQYKESFVNCTSRTESGNDDNDISNGNGNNASNKVRSPVYLNRNVILSKKRYGNNNNNKFIVNKRNYQNEDNKLLSDMIVTTETGSTTTAATTTNTTSTSSTAANNEQSRFQQHGDDDDDDDDENIDRNKKRIIKHNNGKDYNILEALERKLNERPLPERCQTEHPGYDVMDNTECKFSSQDSKIKFNVNKHSYLYKKSAFANARQSHPDVTKRLSSKFRSWLKKWANLNISDVQHKQCTDWLMGRGEGVIPNRTRVLTDNDLSRTPYVPYNRYRVERLSEDTT